MCWIDYLLVLKFVADFFSEVSPKAHSLFQVIHHKVCSSTYSVHTLCKFITTLGGHIENIAKSSDEEESVSIRAIIRVSDYTKHIIVTSYCLTVL